MKLSITMRLAALALSAVMTLLCVHSIANYALPEDGGPRLALSGHR
jgi:hypothetical protein